jgi:hypothetical protein
MAPIESLRSATTYPRRLAQVRRVIASRWAVSFLAWQLGHSTATERRSAGSWDRCATFSSRFERPPTALAHISRAFQGGKPEVAPTNAVISSVLRPDGHRISAAFFAAAGADPSGAGPLPGYLHKRLLGGPFAPLVSAAYGGTPGASSAAMPRPHRWLLSLEHAGADPALNLCDALLQSRSPTFEADQSGFQYFPIPRACLPPTSCSPLDRSQRLRPAAPSTSGSPALLSKPAVVGAPRPFRSTRPSLSLRMPQRSHQ